MAAKASPKTAGLDKRTADLESAIAAITKSFGEGSIMRLGDEGANLKIEAVSTGSLGLDIALGEPNSAVQVSRCHPPGSCRGPRGSDVALGVSLASFVRAGCCRRPV